MKRRRAKLFASPVRSRASGVARQRSVDARDESVELLHVVLQELGGGLDRDLAIIGDEARRELDVRLDRVHLRRVAEAEDTLEMLLSNRGPDLPRRRADHRRRLAMEGVFSPRTACPVDGV